MTKQNIPVVEMLQKIKAGLINPHKLAKETRQACVEVMDLEGYSHAAIAGLLKTSDRTIRRDTEEIRKRNSLRASPELTAMLIGDLMRMAKSHYMRLKQLARSKESSPFEMSKSELMAWKVISEAFQNLNSIGFLMTVEDPKNVSKLVTLKNQDLSHKDEELKKQYAALSPMDKEKLIEKLRQDILKMGGEKGPEPLVTV